ncbi:lysophospholipid acyltransferase family protein [Fontivita pretiosa]|uniref:lysophospholipid acyltransferase family protein n=1 Tax=Fontivita pretiosa TaxID=2989684 RepID=UPI003D164C47
MKSIAAGQPRLASAGSVRWPSRRTAEWSAGWLTALFWLAGRARWIARRLRHPVTWLVPRCSSAVRHAAFANARRILGPDVSPRQCMRFAQAVVARFYDFVLDIAASARQTPSQLRQRIDSIEGREAYLARRRSGGGAVIVTAHMGSFELGLAALAQIEPHIHVVFKRDPFGGFEQMRQQLRDVLGVHEVAIDDGWHSWLKLRDALRENQVVVLQADRALPGQKALDVPMLHGHLRLPLGPLKLAQIAASPVFPVFTICTTPGRCRLFIEPPIEVTAEDQIAPAMQRIAQTLAKFIRQYPDQWLVLWPSFVEDAPGFSDGTDSVSPEAQSWPQDRSCTR